MENAGVISWIGRAVSRWGDRRLLELAGLVGWMLFTTYGIAQGLYRGETPFFLLMVSCGLIFGWSLGAVPLPGWLAGWFSGSAGVWSAMFFAGRMDVPLSDTIRRLPGWLFGAGLEQILPPLGALIASPVAMAFRVRLWLEQMAGGSLAFDSLAAAVFWGTVFFGLGASAGWGMRTGHSFLAVSVAPLAVLGAALFANNGEWTVMLLAFGGALVLMILSAYMRREHRWERSGLDYAENIRSDIVINTLPYVVLILFAAAVIPQIDLGRFLEDIRESLRSSSTSEAGIPGGEYIPPAGPGAPARTVYYPKYHQLGAGQKLSQEVVMTVFVESVERDAVGIDSPRRFYWRSQVYDRYTGLGWISSPNDSSEYLPGDALLDGTETGYAVRHRVVFADQTEGMVFYTGDLDSLNLPATLYWRSNADLFTATRTLQEYTAVSRWSDPEEIRLRSSGYDYPDWIRQRYLQIPVRLPTRIFALAREWTASALTPYDQAVAIQDKLRKIPYSLDVAGASIGRDPVDYFLFDERRGFCDYYASAMVLLARSVGIPARMVVGYAPGTYNEQLGAYVVVEADSHAWAELYFAGVGWVEFEPTASVEIFSRRSEPAEPEAEAESDQSWVAGMAARIILALPAILWTLGALLGLGTAMVVLRSTIAALRLRIMKPADAIHLMYRRLVRRAVDLGIRFSSATTPWEFEKIFLRGYSELAPGRDGSTAADIARWQARILFAGEVPSRAEGRAVLARWSAFDRALRRLRWRRFIASTARKVWMGVRGGAPNQK